MPLKILVISATPWNTNNSFGNSYANIFDGLVSCCTFANIYGGEGVDNDPVVKRAYQITEKQLIMNCLGKMPDPGGEVQVQIITGTGESFTSFEKNTLQTLKKLRWQILFWGQEALWRFGHWHTENFENFIRDFAPDLLFIPIYANVHMCRIDLAVQQIAQVPMLGYISDDNYTLRQFHLSPLYWANRLYFRRLVKKVIDNCKQLYVISDVQKKEYDQIFRKDCHILTKGGDFDQPKPSAKAPGRPLQMMFAGNIGSCRWKSLAQIGQTLKKMNRNGIKIQMTIYTATPLTRQMQKRLNIPGSVYIAGRIPYSEVIKKQQTADILVHVEPTDIVNRWGSHQGFSTKLVDYMLAHRPIVAYGLLDQASISHLRTHDAALIATNPAKLEMVLEEILNCPALLQEYADKGWECGRAYHDIHKFHAMLRQDFERVLNENCSN